MSKLLHLTDFSDPEFYQNVAPRYLEKQEVNQFLTVDNLKKKKNKEHCGMCVYGLQLFDFLGCMCADFSFFKMIYVLLISLKW